MTSMFLSNRYAQVLMNNSESQNLIEEVFVDVLLVYRTLKSNRELQAFLRNPIINNTVKLNVISEIFYNKINETTAAFINFLVDKKRIPLLKQISKSYIYIYHRYKNIKVAHVTTAIKLSVGQKNTIIATLKKQLNVDIQIKEIVEPSIIGGITIRIGDIFYDNSYKTKLRKIKENLIN